MRCTKLVAATAGAGIVASTMFGLASPADAAGLSHYQRARADWVKGDHVAAAEVDRYWAAADHQLGFYGSRYAAERKDLKTLESIPLTNTTKKQRAEAVKAATALDTFFDTPGLYVGHAPTRLDRARADWIKSSEVAAADSNVYLKAADHQLSYYGARYTAARKDLKTLESIPLTNTTKKQRAEAKQAVKALNGFFHTHVD